MNDDPQHLKTPQDDRSNSDEQMSYDVRGCSGDTIEDNDSRHNSSKRDDMKFINYSITDQNIVFFFATGPFLLKTTVSIIDYHPH